LNRSHGYNTYINQSNNHYSDEKELASCYPLFSYSTYSESMHLDIIFNSPSMSSSDRQVIFTSPSLHWQPYIPQDQTFSLPFLITNPTGTNPNSSLRSPLYFLSFNGNTYIRLIILISVLATGFTLISHISLPYPRQLLRYGVHTFNYPFPVNTGNNSQNFFRHW